MTSHVPHVFRPVSATATRSSCRHRPSDIPNCFSHSYYSLSSALSTTKLERMTKDDTINQGDRLVRCYRAESVRKRRIGDSNIRSNIIRLLATTASSENEGSEHQQNHTFEPIYKLEVDFFGEPVSFFVSDSADISPKVMGNVMGALNGGLLAAVSKGLSCTQGGDEAGIELKATHSSAVIWTELLRFATVWNQGNISDGDKSSPLLSCPMLGVVAVAPVIVNTGVAYVRHLDKLLKHTKRAAPGLPPVQIYEIATNAVKYKDHNSLDPREKLHLQALYLMLKGDYQTALLVYLKILKSCPGDVLALSLLMDLCQNLGDKAIALRAAGTISSYWKEREGGWITPSLPGHPMASSLIALGFAVGGQLQIAEEMAEVSMNRGRKFCGALATLAQCHVFDANGRVAEGISAMSNFDGMRNYEGAGFLFFDNRLGGYGARFALDREERGRGKSRALRLYEDHFDRILRYSGFAVGQPWTKPVHRAPLSWRDRNLALESGDLSMTSSGVLSSLIDRVLGRKKERQEEKLDYNVMIQQINSPSTIRDKWEPTAEDVLTWLPPTPQLLSDATLLCLRFTFNGTISNRNTRWDGLRSAWETMLEIQRENDDGNGRGLTFCPVACLAASILFPPNETGGDRIGNGRLAAALYKMGQLMKLGSIGTELPEMQTAIRAYEAERSPNFWLPTKDETETTIWKSIVRDITSAMEGIYIPDEKNSNNNDSDDTTWYADPKLRFRAWDFEARPLLEHTLVYAACKAGDVESLCTARSLCSSGVTLRTSSPEEWWRYSIVLGLLGDQVGSENALFYSIQTGGGQGATGTLSRFDTKPITAPNQEQPKTDVKERIELDKEGHSKLHTNSQSETNKKQMETA